MDTTLFQDLLTFAGQDAYKGNVSFIGEDPVFRTPFRIGDAAAMTIAGCAACAARAWEMRTAIAQDVTVNVRAAAASLRSTRYMRLDGKPVLRKVTPMAGQFEARDGRWIRLNGLTQRFRDGTLALLGCADDQDSLSHAVKKWSAMDLENALTGAGLSGAMVLTADEWAVHPQGQALARSPLVEVIKIGDSAPEPAGNGDRPLGGIRVLDMALALAGPTAGRMLVDHGARVMRVSAPHMTEYRTSLLDTGHGKLSVELDIRNQADRDRLWELARDADVFSQSFRTGAMAKKGFSPEALAEVRPGIIYTSINCFGHQGSWVERPGWEFMAQAVTGMSIDSGTFEKPDCLPAPANDYVTGFLGGFGTMIALLRRAREGGSYHVRVSLCKTAMWIRELGFVDEADLIGHPEDIPPDEIAGMMTESTTPFGHLRHMAPCAQMSATPPRWDRPTAPIGHDEPIWPIEGGVSTTRI